MLVYIPSPCHYNGVDYAYGWADLVPAIANGMLRRGLATEDASGNSARANIPELPPTTWANRAVGAPAGTRQELDGVLYRSDGAGGWTPVCGVASNLLLLDNAVTGATTGWLPSSANPERFMARLLTATGGSAASITIDGSNDAINSAAQIGAFALDTTGADCITPPIKSIYPFVRLTVVAAGTGTIRLGRGA